MTDRRMSISWSAIQALHGPDVERHWVRCRDELGDWRVVLHSPYGMPVHAPWALAVNARIRERLGVDGSAVASDDGIIARIPDAESDPPGAELFVFEPDELEQLVTDEVGGSALFASRFRECAARALLLPRLNPNKRSPLWQQRQKSAQLLEVAESVPVDHSPDRLIESSHQGRLFAAGHLVFVAQGVITPAQLTDVIPENGLLVALFLKHTRSQQVVAGRLTLGDIGDQLLGWNVCQGLGLAICHRVRRPQED